MIPPTRLQNIWSGKQLLKSPTASRASSPLRPLTIAVPKRLGASSNPVSTSTTDGRAVSVRPGLSGRIQEVLRHIEPVKDAASKVQATCAGDDDTQTQLAKSLKALLFKIDYIEEGLLTLVEDLPGERCSEPAPPRASSIDVTPKMPAKLFADIRSRRTDSGDATTGPKVTPAPAKRPPPAAASKKPPPTPSGKKPPPSKAAAVAVKVTTEEPPQLDTDLLPEKLPEKTRAAKPIQWQGLPKEKTQGSIWEDLLKRDRSLMTVREWRRKYELQCFSFPDSNKSDVSLPFLGRDTGSGGRDAGSGGRDAGSGGRDAGSVGRDGGQPERRLEAVAEAPADFKFEIEYDSINKFFFEDEQQKRKVEEKKASLAEAAAAAAKKRLYSVLDEKRTHNVEISLKGLGLRDDFSPIRNAITDLQFGDSGDLADSAGDSNAADTHTSRKRFLKAEDLSLLLGLYPKEEDEIKKLKRLHDDPPSDQRIAPADSFLLCLLTIPRFKQRVEAILSQLTFRSDIVVAMERASKLLFISDLACQSTSSGVLRALLALIVKIGNYINCTTKKPMVAGIPVAVLESLKSIKTLDGTRTFTRVIADHIEEQYPSAWRQLEWLEKCGEAADINVEDLHTMSRSLQSKIDKIRSELDFARAERDTKFIDTFALFVEDGQHSVDALKVKLSDINQRLLDLAKALADKAKTPREAQDVLKKLDHFGRDLFKAKREIDADKAAAERRRVRESLKERTPLAARHSKTATMSLPRSRRASVREDATPANRDASQSSTPVDVSPPLARVRPGGPHRRQASKEATEGPLPRSSESPPFTLRNVLRSSERRTLNMQNGGTLGRNTDQKSISSDFQASKVALKSRSSLGSSRATGPPVAPPGNGSTSAGGLSGVSGDSHPVMSMTESGQTPSSGRRRHVWQSPSVMSATGTERSGDLESLDPTRAKHKKSRSHVLSKDMSPRVRPQAVLPALSQVPSFITEDSRILREVRSHRNTGVLPNTQRHPSQRHSTGQPSGQRLLTSYDSQPARTTDGPWFPHPSMDEHYQPIVSEMAGRPDCYLDPPYQSVSARGSSSGGLPSGGLPSGLPSGMPSGLASSLASGLPQALSSSEMMYERPMSQRSMRSRLFGGRPALAYDEMDHWGELQRAEETARRNAWRHQVYFDRPRRDAYRIYEPAERPSVTGFPVYRDTRRG